MILKVLSGNRKQTHQEKGGMEALIETSEYR